MKSPGGLTALHCIVEYDAKDVGRVLLSHGADTEAKTGRGLTALHGAAILDNTDVAKLLIEHGANVSAVDTEQIFQRRILVRKKYQQEVWGALLL